MLLLCAAAAFADEPLLREGASASRALPLQSEWGPVLDASGALVEAGQAEAARETLEWLLRQPVPDDIRSRARALQGRLPMSREQANAVIQLAAFQTAAGAWLAGPHLAYLTWDPGRSATPYYLGALGGAALGAGTAVWAGFQPGFGPGEARTLLAGEALGAFSGATLGAALDPHDGTGWAWGALAGTAGGAALAGFAATRDPDPVAALGLHHGGMWGAGLAAMGLLYFDGAETTEGALVPIAVMADAGALGGYALGRSPGASAARMRWTSLGAALGAGTAGALVGLFEVETEQSAAILVTIGGVAGGVAGWTTAGRD